MVILQAIWGDGRLHLWGERAAAGHDETIESSRAPGSGTGSIAVSGDAVRRMVGDVYDSLLASTAAPAELTIRWPHRDGTPLRSSPVDSTTLVPVVPIETLPIIVPALSFAADDAVDLLTVQPKPASHAAAPVRPGDSLRYWSLAARLVLELLAQQRFVPAVHRGPGGTCRGYWRVVINDEDFSLRIGRMIAAMPAICRAAAPNGEAPQASSLVENFLWTTVDAIVRRCLEGDELAHALQEPPSGTMPLQMRWLRSVVDADPALRGHPDENRAIFETVSRWLSRLEPPPPGRTCRTCLQLHAPAIRDVAVGTAPERPWALTVHVQAVDDAELVIDAATLLGGGNGDDPRVLRRPFDHAPEQLAADMSKAAEYVPAFSGFEPQRGPFEFPLTIEEAYAFLRDAAPILESEGLGIWLPSWWREDRPKLRMWLNLRPSAAPAIPNRSAIGLDALVTYDWRLAVGDEEVTPEEIARLASSPSPLLRLRGRWTEVQPAELQSALDFLEDRRGGTITLFEALRQCYAADDLNTGVPVAGLRAQGWINNLLNTDIHAAIERVDPPPHFRGTLRGYQLRGLEWLGFLSRLGLGGCLADDMGLGKTIQLIAMWLHEREGGASPGPTLLVVPMSLVGNWHREIERFGPSLKVMVHHGGERLTGREFVEQVAAYDVVISTYGLIHRDHEHLSAVEWYRVALDEAQNIKNPAAKQAVAIRTLRAVHRVGLTGTPVENRLSELWSIMDFLNPGYLGGATEFRRRFAVPIERYHDTDRAQRLRHLIRPFVLRRLKSDPKVEVDLPEKMEMKIYCNLTREQAALYQAIVDEMMTRIDTAGGIQRRGLILAALVKLKQVCNHPALYLGDGSELPHRSGKSDRLAEMLEEVIAEGDRALVFTQFREMGALLRKLLQDTLQREVLFLHGGSTRVQRDAMVADFQSGRDDRPLMVLSLKAGGFGLNLTAANHVFHFDRWWNPAVEDQATDRAHRIGQEHRVQVHKFVCIGTLEERIDSLLEQKRNLADNIVGTGEEWLTELSSDKLREVFELSREAVAED